jgi:hypothetical protein
MAPRKAEAFKPLTMGHIRGHGSFRTAEPSMIDG